MAKKKPRKRPEPRTRAKRRLQLMVIPEPEPNTRMVFVFEGEGTVVMSGPGNVVMECGNCGVPLVDGVAVGNLLSIVFKCPSCGAFNETLA
jgi:predicted RNA-binding Zn-ribbon protein involved in translation (DUF1610 family)